MVLSSVMNTAENNHRENTLWVPSNISSRSQESDTTSPPCYRLKLWQSLVASVSAARLGYGEGRTATVSGTNYTGLRCHGSPFGLNHFYRIGTSLFRNWYMINQFP